MNHIIAQQPKEPQPFNMPCPFDKCKGNISGFCHGAPNWDMKDVETPLELDIFRVDRTPPQWHREPYCKGFERKGMK